MTAHQFVYPRVAECLLSEAARPPVSALDPDREMRCPSCSMRLFSIRAAELVSAGFVCPHCLLPLTLASAGELPRVGV